MTKTLTTERLLEIVERRSPSLRWGEAEQIAAELLANREAQPVGYTSAAALDLLSHGQSALIHKDAETTTFIEEEYRDVVPLFTYAPAVASGENCWSCGKFFTYAQHSECDGYCPHCDAPVDLNEGEEETAPPAPAPAVPPEKKLPELMMASYHEAIGWNACRAAMLAQPFSQGCNWIACGEQLPAVGETVLVSIDGHVSVGESVRSWGGYRYFTSVETGRELTATHWMPLPAAPEGGK